MTVTDELIVQASKIRLFAMDVDGVLTNGDIIYTENGQELKVFNAKDGHGIATLRHFGVQIALITGRKSVITQHRADELGIQHVFQGIKTKLPVLEALVNDLGITLPEVLYMGDDTPDIPVLKEVGLAACPLDAMDEVKRVCHYTTKAPGGRGAVREMTDLVLMAQSASKVTQSASEHIVKS